MSSSRDSSFQNFSFNSSFQTLEFNSLWEEVSKEEKFREMKQGDASNMSGENDQHASDNNQGTKKKNRCLVCKKKIGLTGFTCRCGGLFCGIHRYTDKHECKFDYKALGTQEIKDANPVVMADKIDNI